MRIPAMIFGLAIAGMAGAAFAAPGDDAALAKALGKRSVQGKPQSCIPLSRSDTSIVVDGTAIIYGANTSRAWVNIPRNGAEGLGPDVILVRKSPISSICSGDTVDLIDRYSRQYRGFVILGDFVPYSRPR